MDTHESVNTAELQKPA
jgi:uncharacterized protein (UPF0218 family)